MQINNLTKCCKPRRFANFTADERPSGKKVRYKHYEELSNEELAARSVKKAYESVQNSGKMHLRKAMPLIGTALLGASVAITQPGKLSAKAARGLGFLAFAACAGSLSKAILYGLGVSSKKKEENTGKKISDNKKAAIGFAALAGGVAALTAASVLAVKSGKKILSNPQNPFAKFMAREKNQLTLELNSSKVGKFIENKVNLFVEKHQKLNSAMKYILPFAAITTEIGVTGCIDNSLSKDLKEKAELNFQKGKQIQQIAREHFDSVDAIEV